MEHNHQQRTAKATGCPPNSYEVQMIEHMDMGPSEKSDLPMSTAQDVGWSAAKDESGPSTPCTAVVCSLLVASRIAPAVITSKRPEKTAIFPEYTVLSKH